MKCKKFIKQNAMLLVAVTAAIISLFITPPSLELLRNIDWKTLATLFMLLSILDGFKNENLFLPVIRLSDRMSNLMGVGFFLVFGVFFSSMFVTNDVSLIIFVPLTIRIYRKRKREEFILPLLTMENIAAIRGSLLTPFGSPQNLFLYGNSGMKFCAFLRMMLPLCTMSALLIAVFLLVIFRRRKRRPAVEKVITGGNNGKLLNAFAGENNSKILNAVAGEKNGEASETRAPGNESADREDTAPQIICPDEEKWIKERRGKRILYGILLIAAVISIVSRTQYWLYVVLSVTILLLIFDRRVFLRVDYSLLGTFLCFFIFSQSLAQNRQIGRFLAQHVAGHEYLWSIAISQVISNVPASIVLWPFTENLKALIYGLDTAGLVSIIGSLASVINLRLYVLEYPGEGGRFIAVFEKISLLFFACVVLLQMLLL